MWKQATRRLQPPVSYRTNLGELYQLEWKPTAQPHNNGSRYTPDSLFSNIGQPHGFPKQFPALCNNGVIEFLCFLGVPLARVAH